MSLNTRGAFFLGRFFFGKQWIKDWHTAVRTHRVLPVRWTSAVANKMDSAECELTASHCGVVRFMRGAKRKNLFSFVCFWVVVFFLFPVSRFEDEHNSSGEASEISKQTEQTRNLLDVRLASVW